MTDKIKGNVVGVERGATELNKRIKYPYKKSVQYKLACTFFSVITQKQSE